MKRSSRLSVRPWRRWRWLVMAAAGGLTLGACDGGSCSVRSTSSASPGPSAPQRAAGMRHPHSRYIVVDQFGYRPEMAKVAILVDPILGKNQTDSYMPGDRLEVRRYADDKVVFSGRPSSWNRGKVDPTAGDRGAWFDFSELRTPGSYIVFDKKHGVSSDRFEIASTVYQDVLKAAQRMYYFNRANFAKKKPHACFKDKCWTLGEDYTGAGQDRAARSVTAREDASTKRDLSGGWWDAGDANKYTTFAQGAVHQLLAAYREHPEAFKDDLNIPESNNGVPDLLDELKRELDWLQKMQPADLEGGVLLKLGNVKPGEALPDQSKSSRYYYPGGCSSATIAAASMFAHAALVFRNLRPHKVYAEGLLKRAKRAWDHYQTYPKRSDCDDGSITGGDADLDENRQQQIAVVAAIYLFSATVDSRYNTFVAEHYTKTRPFMEDRWSVYDPAQGDALLYFATLDGADPAVRTAILSRKRSEAATVDIYRLRAELDLYRAYMRKDSFHWGSNMQRANYGNTNYDMVQFALADAESLESFKDRAAGMLHSFHGVNAMQIVYLTNMADYGAERSVNEIYHTWFRDGDSKWDSAQDSLLGPAPGYVAGGPNQHYCEDPSAAQHRCARSALRNQPPEKAFLDFNTGYDPKQEHDKSWEITEPGIYYQAAYIKLLSKFVD